MERTDAPPPIETLHTPEGEPLGRVVAPRPGPVVGRSAGTVYLTRTPRGPAGSGSSPRRRCSSQPNHSF
jgi:hypothetical protein